MRSLPIVLLFATLAACGNDPEPTAEATSGDARLAEATAITKRHPLVDGHVDLPYRLADAWDEVGDDTLIGNFDLIRAQTGGLNAPFMSIYVGADYQPLALDGDWSAAKERADTLIDLVERVAWENGAAASLARSSADVLEQHSAGLVSLPLGMENGAPIGLDLANLSYFHDRGIRYITLTHSRPNQIADSSYSIERPHEGLSDYGETVVREMNRLGIMVDISHVSDAAFWDVMQVSQVPVIASHSSLRRFTPGWERNMADDMVRALGENGGVIMINYGSAFLSAEANRWSQASSAAWLAEVAKNGINADDDEAEDAFYAAYREANPYPYASVSDVADHIDTAVELAGLDHVGLGSDFDGVGDTLPEGLKDAGDMPNLVAELLDRGYSEDEIAMILGGNVLRVWSAVEAFAAAAKEE